MMNHFQTLLSIFDLRHYTTAEHVLDNLQTQRGKLDTAAADAGLRSGGGRARQMLPATSSNALRTLES